MKKDLEFIKTIDSLLNGEHNLSEEQQEQLVELKKQITKSKTFGDLKSIAKEFLQLLIVYFKDP